MSLLGNLLWLLLGGLILGLCYIFIGLFFCFTIIGIPFGYQLMKIGLYALFPFGREIEFGGGEPGCLSLVFNVIWILFGWIELAICHCIAGTVLCLTVIGIPFGLQHFKIARLAFLPFGQGAK